LSPQRTEAGGDTETRRFSFGLRSAVSFREYFDDDPAVKNQRALEAVVGIGLGWAPNRFFTLGVSDDYSRSVSARNQEGPETVARDVNRTTISLGFAPGGGRLTFGLAYGLTLDAYEDSNLSFNNKLDHDISLVTKWHVLPKTALTLTVSQGIIHYYAPEGGPDGYTNIESFPLRVTAGITGLITPNLSVIAQIGYGNGFYKSGANYNNVIANLSLKLRLGPFAQLSVGYDHGFGDSIFGNYYTGDSVVLNYDHVVLKRLMVRASASYSYRKYAGLPSTFAGASLPETFINHLFSLGVGVDYRIREWIFVGVGYDLQLRETPDTVIVQNLQGTNAYTKHQVYGKVGVSY
jgi:hypothetical protein